MRVGTKSVLFGYHAFWLHPFFVAEAWRRLYGFPRDLRLWACFLLHDIGYLGKSNMDGADGETHPAVGAKIIGALFGQEWHDFCLFHSRHYAAAQGKPTSRLCVADKLAFTLYPTWLCVLLCRLSGEMSEYLDNAARTNVDAMLRKPNDLSMRAVCALEGVRCAGRDRDAWAWQRELSIYMDSWVVRNPEGGLDPSAVNTWRAAR